MYTFARHLRTSLARAYDSNVYYRAYALAGTCTLARIRPPVLVLSRMRPLAYAPAGSCMRDTAVQHRLFRGRGRSHPPLVASTDAASVQRGSDSL